MRHQESVRISPVPTLFLFCLIHRGKAIVSTHLGLVYPDHDDPEILLSSQQPERIPNRESQSFCPYQNPFTTKKGRRFLAPAPLATQRVVGPWFSDNRFFRKGQAVTVSGLGCRAIRGRCCCIGKASLAFRQAFPPTLAQAGVPGTGRRPRELRSPGRCS